MYTHTFLFLHKILHFIILAETVQELEAMLKVAIQIMKSSNYPVAAINSGCELFLRFITFAAIDTSVSVCIYVKS